MKKLFLGLLLVIALFAAVAAPAFAAPDAAGPVGPYEGTFRGMVYGSNGSKAPMTLFLTHRGSEVEGQLYVGKGLHVDAGVCGSADLPSGIQTASGRTSVRNPRHLEAESDVVVSGYNITIDLESDVVGDVLTAEATIDLPWICGADPVLTSTLYKA